SLTNDNKPQTSSSSAPQGAHQSNLNQTRPISCFLCKGPHHVAECPHRGSFTAFKAFLQCSNDSEAKTEVEREDERDTRRMGALKLLSTIQNKASHQKDALKNNVLNEYVDIMPPELPKSLPPRQGIDHFIEGFSRRAAPLTELLKKDKTWRWPLECQTGFDELKVTLTRGPVLILVICS
ncbi:hypothetical protein Csa_023676, partial [Cucumis sativus]